MITRPARELDLAALHALVAGAGLPEADLAAHLPSFTVAEEDGELLGCAGAELHGRAAYLRSVAVARHARSEGLGTRLAEEALARAAADGAAEAWLLTQGAEAFFARRGFERCARTGAPAWLRAHPQLTTLCSATAALMRRTPASPAHLFVYGTLRHGSDLPAARALARAAAWLGPARVAARLHDLGNHPAAMVARGAADRCEGEVFALPDDPALRAALLAQLDAYERGGPPSTPGLPFARRTLTARLGDGRELPCATYLWEGSDPPGPVVPHWTDAGVPGRDARSGSDPARTGCS